MTRFVIPADVACANVDDGAVVLHMGTKRYYSLNETGAAIWRLIEESTTIEEIPALLSASYDVTVDEARREVDALLEALEEKTLITVDRA